MLIGMSQPVPDTGGKQSLAQKNKDKTVARAAPLVEAAVGPAERILVAARVEHRVSRWWMLLSSLASLFSTYYVMVLTDHNVVLVRCSRWSQQPQHVESVTPRDQVQVTGYTPGSLVSTFRYADPSRAKPMKLRVYRVYKPEAESMLAQLGAFGLGPGPGQQ